MGILDAPGYSRPQADVKFARPLRHVSTRGQVSDPQSNGTDTLATSRVRYPIPKAAVSVRFVYANFIMTSGVPEASNPYTVTVKAAVEDPALISGRSAGTGMIPIFFGGKRSATLEPGAILISDPVLVNTPDNWAVFVRTAATVTSGDKWPAPFATSSSGSVNTDGSGVGEGVTVGSDLTDSGSFTANSAFAFAPTAVVAEATDDLHLHAVAVIGDSIAKNFLVINPVASYLHQASMDAGLPTMRLALGGDSFGSAKSQVNIWRRGQLFRYVRHAIVNYGINDVRAGHSLATIQADAIAFWTMLARMGVQVHQATLLPNPGASTDGYLTASGQSIVNPSWETVRTGFNTWLRSGQAATDSGGILKSVIDGAAQCEVNAAGALTLNGGFWKPLASVATVSGTATGFTTTTVTDSGKSRTTNQDQSLALTILTASTGAGQIAQVKSNTATVWTLNPAITLPTGTVTYQVAPSPTWDHLHPSEGLHTLVRSGLDLSYLKTT